MNEMCLCRKCGTDREGCAKGSAAQIFRNQHERSSKQSLLYMHNPVAHAWGLTFT